MPRTAPARPRPTSRANRTRVIRAAAWGAVAVLALVSACASPRAAQESAEAATAQVPVSAAFYPLAYLLEQVGGPGVRVWTITKPGVEPHDLELTPKDLVDLPKMSLVAYLKGFQPAVDEAVAQQAPSAAYDVSAAADLTLGAPAGEASATDLHFWLDPIRYAAVGTALGERLALADPTHAADYRARAKTFTASMEQLDKTFATGLASCATKQLVTSHAAFGYLAARYGLTQVPIAGLSPDQEPSAKQLADVAATVKAAGVKTIFSETLVDPKFAQTIAQETGATLALLDPVEGITDQSAAKDYPGVMLANLAALRTGLGCS